MSLFSLKRIFEREKEIRRLRKAYRSLTREWLTQPAVYRDVNNHSHILVHFPGDNCPKWYKPA